MSLYRSKPVLPPPTGPSEFELLKASHKFLREAEDGEAEKTWEDKLASKYYSSLFREFAVCDLKHYKSGNFALRWRTESEVLSGAGESSCGNTRCSQHHPSDVKSSLTTLELPFVYEEHGEVKNALVKTVLCPQCLDKLMWKRRKERKAIEEKNGSQVGKVSEERHDGSRESRHHSRDRSESHRRRSASPRRRR